MSRPLKDALELSAIRSLSESTSWHVRARESAKQTFHISAGLSILYLPLTTHPHNSFLTTFLSISTPGHAINYCIISLF